VRGPDGQPLAKAFVAARPLSPEPGEPTMGTRTDAQGRFELALRRRGPHRVRVESPGLAGRTLARVEPGTPLTIDLARGAAIEGVVRDGDTNEPAPGVRVETQDRDAMGTADQPDAGRIQATTDAAGRFKLAGLGPGRHDVWARARGRSASRRAVAPGARVELTLQPSATLHGVVTGPDGKPVADAIVTALGFRSARVASERSDAQGRYEVAGLAAGLYDVAVRATGLAPGVVPDVVLDVRNETQVDVALRPGARVIGRLLDARDKPLAGRVTVGEISGHPAPYVLLDLLGAQAGADGRFALDAVPVGDHALGADVPGQAPKRVEFAVSATQRQVDLGDVRMETGLVIRGRVRGQSGQPVADATVQASADASRLETQPRARSDAEGTFVLAGLEPLTYRVNAFARGFGSANADVEPGSDPIELVLEPLGTLTGKVVDDRGTPVESFRVVARAAEEGRPWAFNSFDVSDGRFELENVTAGSYVVSVEANEIGSASVSAKVAASSATDLGTVRLKPGATVRGTVVDTGGSFVEGARIDLARGRFGNTITFGTEAEVVTDRSGAFEAKGVEPGSVELRASHPRYAPSAPLAIVIDAGQPVPDVRLTLSQGGRIEGSLRRRDGAPLAGALMNVSPLEGKSGMGEPATATQADGSFAIEHVPAGRVQLTAMTPTGRSVFRSALSRELEVREGETTRADIVNREVLLTGRVTRSGTPAPGLRMEAHGASMSSYGGRGQATPPAAGGPERMAAVTREDGGFEMVVDEPGSIRLVVSSADGRFRFPPRNLQVPDAETFAVDLDFSVVPVSGVVVDRDSEAPLPHAFVFATSWPPKPDGGVTGNAGPDGRFQLELEPAAYRLGARDRDNRYANGGIDVTVGAGGLADVRLELARGMRIAGRALDPAGRGLAGVDLLAASTTEDAGGSAESLADGSFEIRGLRSGPYVLKAWTDTGLFATLPAVEAGTLELPVRLRAGGRLLVETVGTDGRQVPGVSVSVDPAPVGGGYGVTNAMGAIEFRAPEGRVSLSARKLTLRGSAVVDLASGETKPVRIVVEAK
jgi:protocatechuate 3,4-dioxygenase beta subunit